MRGPVLAIVLLLIPATCVFASDQSSCVTCHSALDRKNSEPVTNWKHDIHRESGMGCSDCHGGDPESLESGMSPSKGFRGVLEGRASVQLCGGCHSSVANMPDPSLPTDQLDQYMAGGHSKPGESGKPTCVDCHGSHGLTRITDPSSPVFSTRVAQLCMRCHEHGEHPDTGAEPSQYMGDVHGRARTQGTNKNAPSCTECHGAHRASVPRDRAVQIVCGNCHTKEYEYFEAGPHGDSQRLTGEPTCVSCHGYHGIEAAGIEEIVGSITDSCWKCHDVDSNAWTIASKIDGDLGVAMSLLGSLRDRAEEFRLMGIETSEMEQMDQEAYTWLLRVESAIHSVNADWEELTGMAKVKMMAAWNLARDYNLEKGIRRVILLLISLLALLIFALLAYKLRLVEGELRRRHLLGSPEARQREQEHDGK